MEKFAHLIQPLRDLADNWNIDIARDLEEYLEILEGITFTFEDGGKALNFAQAALLIQGSACVYSKKVEYLYNLVFQALEFITTRKRTVQAEESAAGEEQKEKEDDPTDAEFLSLDDLPTLLTHHDPVATNIDLDDTKERTDVDHGNALAPAHRPFAPLVSISVATETQRGSSGSDFQMNSCLIHRNGALVLESAQASGDWLGVPLPKQSTAAPAEALQIQTAEHEQEKPTTVTFLDDAILGDGAPGDSDEDVGGDGLLLVPSPAAGLQDLSTSMQPADGAATSAAAVPQTPPQQGHAMTLRQRRQSRRMTLLREDGGDVVVEEWALLEPHEVTVPIKPFKRGKTFRIPRSLTQDGRTATEPDVPAVRVRAPFFEEFDQLYEAEMKRRRAAFAARRKPAVVTVAGQADKQVLLERVEQDQEEVFFEQPFAVVEEGAVGLPADDAPAPVDDTDDEDRGDPVGLFEDTQPSVTAEACSTAIAETAAILADDTQRIAERHRQEANLIARIADWHNRLEPILEAQESRRGFDIQECATELLEEMERPEVVSKDARSVTFATLVKGREPWEICRYFLSSLLLINCGNVEVTSRRPLEFSIQTTEKRFDACNTFEAQQQQLKEAAASSRAAPEGAIDSSKAGKPDAQKKRKKARKGAEEASVEEELAADSSEGEEPTKKRKARKRKEPSS